MRICIYASARIYAKRLPNHRIWIMPRAAKVQNVTEDSFFIGSWNLGIHVCKHLQVHSSLIPFSAPVWGCRNATRDATSRKRGNTEISLTGWKVSMTNKRRLLVEPDQKCLVSYLSALLVFAEWDKGEKRGWTINKCLCRSERAVIGPRATKRKEKKRLNPHAHS